MKSVRAMVGWLTLGTVGCSVDYGVKGQPAAPDAPAEGQAPLDVASDTATVETGAPVEDTGAEATTDDPLPPEDTGGTPDTAVPDEPDDATPAVACAPGADGVPVGCAMEVGAGRLFMWGDEHVTFEDYRPDSQRFWAGALAWLADSGRVSVDDRRGSAVVPAVAATLGLTMGGSEADIVIVDLWSGAGGADIAAWLGEGRAVMVMAIGFGTSECSYLSSVTAGLPLRFDCAAEPWGPVGAFAEHPITLGLSAADAPFVNGRAVVADDPSTAEAVAFVR
jgi:hypothetical protein